MRQQVAAQEQIKRGNASLDLIVAERQTSRVLGCRVGGRAPRAFVLALQRRPPPVAVDVDFEDRCVVDQPVHRRQRHRRIGEDLAPRAKRLIGSDQRRAALVTRADHLEQHRGLRLILADIGEVIEDQQMEAVEPGNGGLQGEFAARHLELLHQVGGAGEQHAPTVFHQCHPDGRGQVRLAAARRSSGILPGIKTLKSPSITPFTPKRAKLPSLQTGVVVLARHRSPFASRTEH